MHFIAMFIGVLAVTVPQALKAQVLTTDPCFLDLPCVQGGLPAAIDFLENNIFPYAYALFITAFVWAFFNFARGLIFDASEENTQKEAKEGIANMIYAGIFLSIAAFIVATFGRNAADTLIEPEPFNEGIRRVTLFFKVLVGTVLTAVIVAQGFFLVIAKDDGEVEKHRKRLFHAILGVVIILLANAIVAGVAPGYNSSTILAGEIVGIANYVLAIFALLCVLSFIIAGLMLILSVKEDMKDKAKTVARVSAISLIVVILSYVIVAYFILL